MHRDPVIPFDLRLRSAMPGLAMLAEDFFGSERRAYLAIMGALAS